MESHAEVPVGINAHRWNTVRPRRTALIVVHNVTTLTRLLDVLPIFDSDPRVQTVFSWSGSDPFRHGVAEALSSFGALSIPWEQAKQTRFDLVVAASHHGSLTDLNSPLVILSHGIGYTKYSPGKRKKEREAGNPFPPRATFGLSPQWVLNDGEPFAAALALSHDEQLDRLAASAPAALPVATVIGDPCYDRIRASTTYRQCYRASFESADRAVVLISSTWGSNSLLGSWPELIRRLLAECPIDEYQFLVALHPNTWHGHGPAQIRSWLGDCLRAGMILLPEIDGWRAGLLAADIVIGDHGSVTGYAAALGIPTLLATFPDEDVAAGSPIAKMGEIAPRLTRTGSLLPQLRAAVAEHVPERSAEVADLVTSAPGRALDLLREVCYQVLKLPEPDGEIPLAPLRTPPISAADRRRGLLAFRAEYLVDFTTNTVHLRRYPAESRRQKAVQEHDELLCCPWDDPMRSTRASAAVLTCSREDLPGTAANWLSDVVRANPACQTAAVLDSWSCELLTGRGLQVRASAPGLPPDALAVACHAWSRGARTFPQELSVELGGRTHAVQLG